ncbi:MAG TPA: RNA polymerase factor sigma-32 [Thermodesulfobacteriota bacterium]|nr:RNA polymerase factor sigma-32 [Patescibacteria group bacterium]HLE25900.1 RNA polymerase factor sigma-32 [Thermodesulfobacteriota bacterium]
MREIAFRDPLSLFLKEIEKYPVLSREEEYELALKHYKEGDLEAARRLVVSNLRFVVKIASQYASYGFPLLDLIQEGTIGLMRAVKKFNPYRGYRLISYAVWWIKARIQSYIMKSWSLVKIGTTQAQRKLFQSLRKAKRELSISHDELTNEDLKNIAGFFDVREKDVLGMEMRMAGRDFSLNMASSDDESITYIDSIPDSRENQEDIIDSVETNEMIKESMQDGFQKLSQKERYIVEKRYLSNPPLKLKDLGGELGISKERVRQIESQALKKLRMVVENRLNGGYAIT